MQDSPDGRASSEALRKEAKRAYKSGALEEAERLYAELTASPDPSLELQAADYQGRASALIGLGRMAEAVEWLEQAVAAAPTDTRLRFKLGEILARLGRHVEALEQFEICAGQEPGAANHHARVALELRALGRIAESRKAVRRCLEIDPAHVDAQLLQVHDVGGGGVTGGERDGLSEEIAQAEGGALASGYGALTAGPGRAGGAAGRTPAWMIAAQAVALLVASMWLLNQIR